MLFGSIKVQLTSPKWKMVLEVFRTAERFRRVERTGVAVVQANSEWPKWPN
jgi:hypothetical protein